VSIRLVDENSRKKHYKNYYKRIKPILICNEEKVLLLKDESL